MVRKPTWTLGPLVWWSTSTMDVFSLVREKMNRNGGDADMLAKSLEGLLAHMEEEAPLPKNLQDHHKSKAGHCVAFHAGEQAHAGTSGWD